jgi:hypothetical protein
MTQSSAVQPKSAKKEITSRVSKMFRFCRSVQWSRVGDDWQACRVCAHVALTNIEKLVSASVSRASTAFVLTHASPASHRLSSLFPSVSCREVSRETTRMVYGNCSRKISRVFLEGRHGKHHFAGEQPKTGAARGRRRELVCFPPSFLVLFLKVLER